MAKHKQRQRPPGYWQNWSNVEQELQTWIATHGKFPSKKNLATTGCSSLARVIVKYHGGFTALRPRMGQKPREEKPAGYWQNWGNAERELRAVIVQLGHFPTQKELSRLGKAGLKQAIHRQGGFAMARRKLEYPVIKKTPGYWNDWSNVERELHRVIAVVGHFPSHGELVRLGRSSLAKAIADHFGGFRAVRTRLGHIQKRVVDGHWRNWSNIEQELRAWIAAHGGQFPTADDLVETGYSSLAAAIGKYQGGFAVVQVRMGYTASQHPKGYWREWVAVEVPLRESIARLGHFPTEDELRELGMWRVINAIHRYHSGFDAVRVRMGYRPSHKPTNYWGAWSNIEQELRAWIAAHGGQFPTANALDATDNSSMSYAICRYHGGFAAVRTRLGYGPVTDEILKTYAELLVRVLLALQQTQAELTSDQLWETIRRKWAEAQLKKALQGFEERGDLAEFCTLIQGG